METLDWTQPSSIKPISHTQWLDLGYPRSIELLYTFTNLRSRNNFLINNFFVKCFLDIFNTGWSKLKSKVKNPSDLIYPRISIGTVIESLNWVLVEFEFGEVAFLLSLFLPFLPIFGNVGEKMDCQPSIILPPFCMENAFKQAPQIMEL